MGVSTPCLGRRTYVEEDFVQGVVEGRTIRSCVNDPVGRDESPCLPVLE